jgi:Ring finger domain
METESASDGCCICFEKILSEKDRVYLKCGHMFHFSCILKVNYQKCPLCRDYYGSIEDEVHNLSPREIRDFRLHRSCTLTIGLLDSFYELLNNRNEMIKEGIEPPQTIESCLLDFYSELNRAFDMLDSKELDDPEEEFLCCKLKNKIRLVKHFIKRYNASGGKRGEVLQEHPSHLPSIGGETTERPSRALPEQEIEHYMERINRYYCEKRWLYQFLESRGETINISGRNVVVIDTDDKATLLQQIRSLNIC